MPDDPLDDDEPLRPRDRRPGTCSCGSGQHRSELKCNGGIFLTYICSRCEARKREEHYFALTAQPVWMHDD